MQISATVLISAAHIMPAGVRPPRGLITAECRVCHEALSRQNKRHAAVARADAGRVTARWPWRRPKDSALNGEGGAWRGPHPDRTPPHRRGGASCSAAPRGHTGVSGGVVWNGASGSRHSLRPTPSRPQTLDTAEPLARAETLTPLKWIGAKTAPCSVVAYTGPGLSPT